MPNKSDTTTVEAQETEILRLFDVWNEALKSRDPAQVVALYAPDAILLPTVSNQVRHNHTEIEDYFETFLRKKPIGRIIESNVIAMGDVAVHSGLYCFDLNDHGHQQTVPARFSFVYKRAGGEWKIVEHHSSYMPEPEVL